ncbi:MAG TPA: hypothetical protein VFJ51_06050 [Nitrososphaeraceae archaeon]|nr:hypothetical protein [Nitrososphaeraceae archaeon]
MNKMIRKFKPAGVTAKKGDNRYLTIDDLIQSSLKSGWHLGITKEQQQKSIEDMINELISSGMIEEVTEE